MRQMGACQVPIMVTDVQPFANGAHEASPFVSLLSLLCDIETEVYSFLPDLHQK